MRGRKHPLEIYQRASPFEGWEEEQNRKARAKARRSPKPPRRPRKKDPGGGGGWTSRWTIRGVPWYRFFLNKAAGARRKVRAVPLRRAVWVASPLVLAALVFYAVKFWPVGGSEGSPDPNLRNEWRDPTSGQQDQDTQQSKNDRPAPRFYIQLKSGPITPLSDNPSLQARHEQDVENWLGEMARQDALLQKVLAEGGLGDLGLVVDAWHSDMEVQADVRLVIGGWEQKDEQVRSLHSWLKENGFEDALIIEF